MFKASNLLNVEDPQHCIAHTLHLLLTTDGFAKCPPITNLLEKAKNIVSASHSKSYSLSEEMFFKEDMESYNKLKSIAEVQGILISWMNIFRMQAMMVLMKLIILEHTEV